MKKSLRTRVIYGMALAALASPLQAFAAGPPQGQPYIDKLKSELPPSEPAEPYIDRLKQKMGSEEKPAGNSPESYINELKQKDPEKYAKPDEKPKLIESEKERLGKKDEGGAIEALHEGRSELKPRFQGEIHHAFGLRIAASMDRTYTSDGSRSFASVYGTGFAPDVTLFYEFQPFRSEWAGNFGIYGSVGASYYSGTGSFKYGLNRPAKVGTVPFSTESRTKFKFFVIPSTLALDYRFNLLHYLRPFVIMGPTLITYVESRNDQVDGNHGLSKGLFVSGGVSVLLDWLSGSTSWDSYAENSIRHSYLTVEYNRLSTMSGDVNFSASGISAGVTFEY